MKDDMVLQRTLLRIAMVPRLCLAAVSLSSLLATPLRSSVSITASNVLEVQGPQGQEIPLGTLGLLVVDTGNDGFEELAAGSIQTGTFLGNRLGVDNDLVVHRIFYQEIFGRAVFSLGQGSPAFALNVSSPPGLAKQGDTIALFWFPGLGIDDQLVHDGQPYGQVRGEDWIVPGDGSTVSFKSITGTPNASSQVLPVREPVDPDGDPDGDRIPNLLEEAFGGNPNESNASILPTTSVVEVGGSHFAEIRYRQIKDESGQDGTGTVGVDYTIAGIRYVVEISHDLRRWESGEALVEQVGNVVDNGDGTVTAAVRAKSQLSVDVPLFLRLQLVRDQ